MADEKKAAFGVFPQMKPRRSRQDPEAAKNVPIDVARGFVSGTLGMPGDIESFIRLIPGLDEETILPTSEDILRRIPFGSDTPAGRAASGLGVLSGGFYTGPGSAARAITAVPKAIKRAGQDFAMAAGETGSRIFIGPKAKTWDKAAADAAERMEKAGVDPVDIWRQTGTFRGADGILRQEISDVGVLYRNERKLKELGEAKKAEAKELKQRLAGVPGQKDLFPKALTEAKRPVREQIKELSEEARSLSDDPAYIGHKAKFVFEHPELYKAYPDLADLKVLQGGTGGPGTKGSLSTAGGSMEMDLYDFGMKTSPRSTLLHEMQHAVQTLEQMAPGGNTAMAFLDPKAFDILKKLREEITSPPTFEEFQRANRYPAGDAEKAYEEFVKNYKFNLTPAIDRQLQERAAEQYYQRLAGEAEARATQAREPMGPTQRRQEFPYSSYDVLPEDLIVKDPKQFARGGKVRFTDNPDAMRLELAGGGLAKLKKLVKGAQETPKPLERAPAKSKEEIRAIAERIAPQMTGEYVRGKGAQTIAGKTQKQFQREKGLQHDIRPTGQSMPEPETVNIESLKDKVMIGIAGDPSIGGQTVYRVGDVPLESPSPQHAGPLYGLGRDDQKFWASGKGAATRVQNLADEVAQQYGDREVLGNYIMMTPDSANYAQHFADANLQAIDLSKMTKQQIEQFNELIRRGNAKSGPRPSFPGIEDKGAAYLHFSIDPKLRIHFNELMQMPTVTERLNLPSGADVLHAITEPDLRDLERGVTGKSIGRMIPGGKLTLSEHPTYSHDIPGEFMGSSKYPMPYELTFPDTLKSVRENPEQAPQEFGSLKLVGPRQIIDQQLIDEIRMYEEMIKALTGRAEGGAVEMAGGGTMSKVAMEAIAKLKLLREEAAAKAAQQAQYAKEMEGLATRDMPTFEQWKSVQDKKTGYAAGGEITADDLIIEERPL